MGAAHYEIFKDAADEWRWRLVAGNGETVAQSEAYTTKERRRARRQGGGRRRDRGEREHRDRDQGGLMPAYIWQLLALFLIVVIVLVLVDAV